MDKRLFRGRRRGKKKKEESLVIRKNKKIRQKKKRKWKSLKVLFYMTNKEIERELEISGH